MFIKLLSLSLINLITYLLVVLVTGVLFLMGKISFKNFIGKCGYIPLRNIKKKKFVWFHVSSAGEWNTGKIFAKRLQENMKLPLLITYFNEDLDPVISREREFLSLGCESIYLPVENSLAFWVMHRHYRIQALIILETEIWPTMILFSHWLGKKIFLVNAVLFPKETRNFLIFKPFFSSVLRCFNHIFCISEKSKENFLKLGVDKEKISVNSNFKYDVFNKFWGKKDIDWNKNKNFRDLKDFFSHQAKKKRKIIIFASFHDGEIQKIFPEVKKFFQDDRYSNIIAPRYIRTNLMQSLETFFKKKSLSYLKRSELSQNRNRINFPPHLILDSFGELSTMYAFADLVIMGGSFVPIGGHNFLEAVFFDKPVFVGEFIHHHEDFVDNFKDHVKLTNKYKIGQDIDKFFLNRLRPKNGFETIQKFSGSSLKIADWVSEKLKF